MISDHNNLYMKECSKTDQLRNAEIMGVVQAVKVVAESF